MRVLMISPEVTPFAQTGGLGEVLSGLPAELVALGLQVDVLMPRYRGINLELHRIKPLDLKVEIDLNANKVVARFWEFLDERGVRYLFLENERYFDREGLYGTRYKDYEDNAERFVFLTRAAIEMALARPTPYEIFHAHEWQAALTPVYLRTLFAGEPLLRDSASVMTIHNLGYQGIFGHQDMPLVGLGWEFFNYRQMEFHGQLNFLKSGIVFADKVNTVSPSYREEILSEEFGFGLEGVLQEKGAHLSGILNGVDYNVWNPATDPHIAANYDPDDLSGKAICKANLQRIADLPVRPDVPVIGVVSRLSPQKGIDMLQDAIPSLVGQGLQLVVLGTGEPQHHDALLELGRTYLDNTAIFLSYDQDLAHKIFAGSDMILVPSRYEPCGLNQLYALKYGTAPVVRATGGLNDTVEEFDGDWDRGTGFKFVQANPKALEQTVFKAARLYREDLQAWKRLMIRCMNQDFSWKRSALAYKELYEKALQERQRVLNPRFGGPE